LLGTNFWEGSAQFSHDGRWVAYASLKTGRREIYIASFPSLSTKVQISTAGGIYPRWRGDDKELYYVSFPDTNMMAVGLDLSGGSARPSTPSVLFKPTARGVNFGDYVYDVTADGKKFLVNSLPPERDSKPITIYANWPAALKK
jgi:hypothetical protein